MKNLLHHPKFCKATEIVRKYATGYCLAQAFADSKFVWEMWQVGRAQVLVTAKALPAPRTEDDVLVEVWAPITESIAWEDTDRAVAAIKRGKLDAKITAGTWRAEHVAHSNPSEFEIEVVEMKDGEDFRALIATVSSANVGYDEARANAAWMAKTPEMINALSALESIKYARDFHAEHGEYPENTVKPDQQFDDWAADVASIALRGVPPRKVYVYVEGGAVQGASGPPGTEFILLDKDNADADDDTREQMEQNEKQRDADEAAGFVVGIF